MATFKSKQKKIIKKSEKRSKWQLVLALLLEPGVGWFFGNESGQKSMTSASGDSSTESATTDSYGPSPGHAHFGHAHP